MSRPRPLASLVAGLADAIVNGDAGVAIDGVAYDSREVQPGYLFVALRGIKTDGHCYLGEAFDRGAVAALTEEPVADARCRCNVVVPDTRAALARVAGEYYGHPSRELGLIGITGTKGKTTTSYLVEAVLRHAGHETGLIGTVDLKVGPRRWRNPLHQTTPESLDVQRYLREMVDAGVGWTVLETSSHGLATHRVDGCAYDIAAVTNVTHEHLEFHKTYANYLAAKATLLDRVVGPGAKGRPRAVILNRDDPGSAGMARRRHDLAQLTFGLDDACDVRARDLAMERGGMAFELCTPQGSWPVRMPLVGRFNVYNALAAAAIALVVGVPVPTIAAGLATVDGVPGRLEWIAAGQPFEVVVDYAHNPDSLGQILRLLRSLTGGRLIAVFGSAGERDVAKRELMGRVCAELADYAVFTDEDPRGEDRQAILREIAAGASARGWREGRDYELIADRARAIERAFQIARPGDTVLLTGKGHEETIEYGDFAIPWDEATAPREALARLGYDGQPSVLSDGPEPVEG